MENQSNRLIQHATVAPQSVIDLLKSTVIGTEGSLYQLLDTENKIHQLDQPNFYFIERNNKAIANITICQRSITCKGIINEGLYLRYFAFDPIFQGGTAKRKERNSILDKELNKIFDSGNLNETTNEIKSTIFWAYIDPQNLKSFNMNERFNFETIGAFKTIAFSRFFPKKISGVERIKKTARLEDRENQAEVLRLINDFYKEYAFVFDAQLFRNDNFFVYKVNGEIVAGVQANPSNFKLVSLPGLFGKLMLKVVPFVPLLRRIINPKRHKFLATEALFWKPGHEDKLSDFLSGVLAETQHHSLLIWEDVNANKISKLNLKWGALQKLKANNEINIVAKFIHLDNEKIEAIKSAPKYLSGFDMT